MEKLWYIHQVNVRVKAETCELVLFTPAHGIIERGFHSKRSSSRSTVWDLWKFDTHLKEIQVSRQNLCKMKFAKNVNENLTSLPMFWVRLQKQSANGRDVCSPNLL